MPTQQIANNFQKGSFRIKSNRKSHLEREVELIDQYIDTQIDRSIYRFYDHIRRLNYSLQGGQIIAYKQIDRWEQDMIIDVDKREILIE